MDGWKFVFLPRFTPCFLLTDKLYLFGSLCNQDKFLMSLVDLYFYSLSRRLVISTKSEIVVWLVCLMISPLDLGVLMSPPSRSLEMLLDAAPARM